jgi:hypothetical protein
MRGHPQVPKPSTAVFGHYPDLLIRNQQVVFSTLNRPSLKCSSAASKACFFILNSNPQSCGIQVDHGRDQAGWSGASWVSLREDYEIHKAELSSRKICP